MRHDMENCDETLTLWGERERERRSLGFQIWGFGRENERAVGMWDAIYIQNYVLYFTKLPHAPISFFFF